MKGTRLGNFGLTAYNLFYWPYLLLSCTLLFFPALAIYLLTFWDPKRRLLHRFTSLWGAHYLAWAPFAISRRASTCRTTNRWSTSSRCSRSACRSCG